MTKRWDFSAAREREMLILVAAASIVLGYAASLALKYAAHDWIVDSRGHPALADFIAFRAAGLAALKGMALAAYDAHRQHAGEVAVVGHPFDSTFGWYYPPLFLFVAAALAYLPYTLAFLAWIGGTAALYAAAVATIARKRIALVIACAAPWMPLTMLPGQNGFLTAALIGTALLQLEKRPALAGLALGFLSYKPQFGILFPLALAAGGYWRTFAWAALSTLGWNVLAGIAFGFGTFGAFLHAMSVAAGNHLATNGLGWNKLLSVFGFARALGASEGFAWSAQALTSMVCVAAVSFSWRAQVAFPLKAALLSATVLLATPYVLNYDQPILAVAIAFLFRHRAFDRNELGMLAIAMLAIYPVPACALPLGFFGSLAVAAIALTRVYCTMPRARMSPSWATEATSLPSAE